MEDLKFAQAIEIGTSNNTPEEEINLDNLGISLEESDIDIDSPDIKIKEPTSNTLETKPTKGSKGSEGSNPSADYLQYVPDVANFLAEKGLIDDLPEGVNIDEFGAEALVKTLEHATTLKQQVAWEQGVKDEQNRIINKVSPLTQKMLSYNLDNPNADDKDIQSYISSIIENEYVTNLTVENNASQIVNEYYAKVLGWEKNEVEEKIAELVEGDNLNREATRIKPKLESHSSKVIQSKADAARVIAEQTRLINEQLEEQVRKTLSTGKLNNVPISKEDQQFIYTALMNNEVPVTIKGKKVEMGYAEAFVMQQKYQGNLEYLSLGLLVMKHGPEAISKYVATQANTRETENFIKQHKFSNRKKKTATSDNNKMYDRGGLNFEI